jgi:hypothetical protein
MVGKDSTAGKCLNCRAEVLVPNSFADADLIQCGVCRMSLKILRAGGALRLAIADVGPLRDEVKSIELRMRGLETDLARARASFGIGANGFGLAVVYVVYQIAFQNRNLSKGLMMSAIAIAIGTGLLLEFLNFFFLAKRREMSRLSDEIDQANADIRERQAKIRDSLRK